MTRTGPLETGALMNSGSDGLPEVVEPSRDYDRAVSSFAQDARGDVGFSPGDYCWIRYLDERDRIRSVPGR